MKYTIAVGFLFGLNDDYSVKKISCLCHEEWQNQRGQKQFATDLRSRRHNNNNLKLQGQVHRVKKNGTHRKVLSQRNIKALSLTIKSYYQG